MLFPSEWLQLCSPDFAKWKIRMVHVCVCVPVSVCVCPFADVEGESASDVSTFFFYMIQRKFDILCFEEGLTGK